MLQDSDPGKTEEFIGGAKTEVKVEEKKQEEMKPPEEFVYDQLAQEEGH